MGHRLSRITTRTGDDGTTGLADGSRIAKDSLRIQAIGDVDELNSAMGLIRAHAPPDDIEKILVEIQNDMFNAGGDLSLPGATLITGERIEMLEKWLADLNAGLPPLKEFVLPSGPAASAAAHLARTICRRAERSVIALGRHERLNESLAIYLNRLSDLLFVIARTLARVPGSTEQCWVKPQ